MKKYAILFLFLSGCATIGKTLEVDVNNDFPHNEVQKIAIVAFETSLAEEGTTGIVFKSSSVENVKTVFTGIMARELRKWERFAILEGKTLEKELESKNLGEDDFLKTENYSSLGRSIGVDAIIVGEVERYGYSYTKVPLSRVILSQTFAVSFKAKCIDVITNETIWTADIEGTSKDDNERVIASVLITEAVNTLKAKLN
ncbi:MAG: hypothetical protein MAG551_00069 [Candidatus Scalindua arabica]|uniref:Curli production assembly/transport component CsgG n=1 Tax=Candidatus Scalindua arabica TaxID=1127984 RepID=A0A941VZJ7_9BACT|nr:hypothetical protein [Candidatus Scalindua arabica]